MTAPRRFCANCGAALTDGVRFCESCGHQIGASVSSPASADSVNADAPTTTSCASCGANGRVVAASAYRAANDAKTDDPDRMEPDGVETFLERPEPPEAPSVMLWMLAAFIPFALFVVYWWAPINRAFKVLLLCATIAFFATVPPFSDAGWYPVVGLVHFALYWLALMAGRGASRAELAATRMPAYQARLARWERLQYCMTCQQVWLDTARAKPVRLVDVESLLTE